MNGISLICVTNRSLCPSEEAFLTRLERIASTLEGQGAILLREKDLPETEYGELAQSCQIIAQSYHTPLMIHSYPAIAEKLAAPLHLPLPLLRKFAGNRTLPAVFGSSVHSVEEAKEAERLGASYLIAGHIFPTDCKKGLPARGLDFLRQVVQAVKLPVYGIGGITAENGGTVLEAGAAGLCVMSHFMTCPNTEASMDQYRRLFHAKN
ncbi:MAG: thiamine phosphate synthase [Clostridiales bacterium]|nr:thiamine phosphate synthase [Clostridiales bacterium]